MKESKTVLAVILGMSLVSLITALVAALADGLMVLIDGKYIFGDLDFIFQFNISAAVLELVMVGLGIAFVIVFVCAYLKKIKTYYTVQIRLLWVLVACFILTTVILRIVANIADGRWMVSTTMSDLRRPIFLSYFATALTITISTALVYFSALFLRKLNEEDLSGAVTQGEVAEVKTELADTNDSEAE